MCFRRSLYYLIVFIFIVSLSQQSKSQGLDFDGSDDYVTLNSLANDMQGLTSFTIECWVKIDSIYQTGQGGIFGVHTSTGGNVMILLAGGGGGNNQISVYDGGATAGYEIIGGKVADFSWHHIAYVRSGSSGVVYLDGVSQGIHTANYAFTSTDRWSLGQEWDGANSSDHLNGLIDELRIWKVARSALQINDDMHRELCQYPTTLAGYYKMNQGTEYGVNLDEDTVIDVSVLNNIGIPENFALAGNKSNFGEDAGVGSRSTQVTDACKKFESPSGKFIWTESGTYKDTVPNKDGCDSIITFELTVNQVNTQITLNGDTLEAAEIGATYHWLDCDDDFKAISGASGKKFVPEKSGRYAVLVVKNNCPDTSECYTITGTESHSSPVFRVYPNPFRDQVHIDFTGNSGRVTFTDLAGRVLLEEQIEGKGPHTINTDLKPGMYMLQINDGQRNQTFRLFRE